MTACDDAKLHRVLCPASERHKVAQIGLIRLSRERCQDTGEPFTPSGGKSANLKKLLTAPAADFASSASSTIQISASRGRKRVFINQILLLLMPA
jgi:hypothetical protein